jgi:hypothetical protein
VVEVETEQIEGGELMADHAPSYAPSIAKSMLQALPDAMHATNATNATHVRNQDSGEIVAVPDTPTPVDKPESIHLNVRGNHIIATPCKAHRQHFEAGYLVVSCKKCVLRKAHP